MVLIGPNIPRNKLTTSLGLDLVSMYIVQPLTLMFSIGILLEFYTVQAEHTFSMELQPHYLTYLLRLDADSGLFE